MRRRFFVQRFAGDRAVMEGQAAHHLGRVLRAQTGQLYELSDGQRVSLARIEDVGPSKIEFALIEDLPSAEPRLNLTLILAVVKFDAFEWAIEKATELGVTTIVPVAAGRSEKALLAAAPKRAGRWQKIVLEASQQSRRVRVPVLKELAKTDAAFVAHREGLPVLLSERGDAAPLRKVLASQNTLQATVAVGPEGGWTEAEYDAAARAGFQQASLGHLILRTETAVVSSLAAINFALEDA